MKKNIIFTVALSGFVLSAEQMVAHSHTKYVVVEEAAPVAVMVEEEPPALIVEQVTPSPGAAYVWKEGYWKWNGHWKWVRGRWELKPSSEAVWVPGVWEQHHHHWVYKEGHWR